MKIRTPYLVMFLLFVVLGVYYPSLFAPFNTVDDRGMINALLNFDHFSLKDIFFPGENGYYYRPLLSLTFIADNFLWGQQPSFMHLENILIHAVNTLLVFFIAGEISKRYGVQNSLLSLSASLLFALHPINTEPVNWISGRTDLLAALFILLSTFLLLRALATESKVLSALASSSFLLSCLAKDSAIFFFPAVILIIWHTDVSGESLFSSFYASLKKRFFFFSSYSFAVITYFTFRHIAFAKADSGISTAAQGVIGHNARFLYTLKVILKLLGFYVKKLFFPMPLNFAISGASDYYIPLGIIIIIVCLYLIYRRDLVADLFLASICVVSPAFLVALNRMAWTPIAERYLYIPAATFAIGMAFSVFFLCRRFNWGKVLPLFAVMLYVTSAYATVERNFVWQDNLTLFQDTIRKSPGYPPIINELALALKDHGRNAEGDAMLMTNSMGKNAKNKEFCDLNRAALLCGVGDFKSARRLLLDNLNPSSAIYPQILLKLANVDGRLLEQAASIQEKEQIRKELISMLKKLQDNTGDPYFLYRLGQQFLFAGEKTEAQKYFAKAYEAAPEGAHYKMAAKKLAEKLKQ